jgi:hypothetical protein
MIVAALSRASPRRGSMPPTSTDLPMSGPP